MVSIKSFAFASSAGASKLQPKGEKNHTEVENT